MNLQNIDKKNKYKKAIITLTSLSECDELLCNLFVIIDD